MTTQRNPTKTLRLHPSTTLSFLRLMKRRKATADETMRYLIDTEKSRKEKTQ